MGKRISFEEEKCTNCNLCSMYCSLNFTRNGVYEYRPSIARIRVSQNDDDTRYVAHVCLQCESPACMEACPVDAISKDQATGIVSIDEEECTGCESCIDACEFDCVFMVGGVAVKCEVCDDPLCVKACAVKALELVDDDDVKDQELLYREVGL
ncbi:MAG: 4Fe-4S dicluster domain-containing protein [Actinobacteria bacterium]|nr:4Fe-4S dicluster domain-containing protein [Actinomycetota bacterium]